MKRQAARGSLRISRERFQPQARPHQPVEPAASQSREAPRLLGSQEEDADRPEGATRPTLRRHERELAHTVLGAIRSQGLHRRALIPRVLDPPLLTL